MCLYVIQLLVLVFFNLKKGNEKGTTTLCMPIFSMFSLTASTLRTVALSHVTLLLLQQRHCGVWPKHAVVGLCQTQWWQQKLYIRIHIFEVVKNVTQCLFDFHFFYFLLFLNSNNNYISKFTYIQAQGIYKLFGVYIVYQLVLYICVSIKPDIRQLEYILQTNKYLSTELRFISGIMD